MQKEEVMDDRFDNIYSVIVDGPLPSVD